MKFSASIIITIIFTTLSSLAMANDIRERMYLTQMINQLDALKPLIIAASKEQETNVRIQFHYYSYRDVNGTLHNGLLDDINEIKKGIYEKLNQTIGKPRNFQKIKGDYLNTSRIHAAPIYGEEALNNDK